jgi:hypothetical protein
MTPITPAPGRHRGRLLLPLALLASAAANGGEVEVIRNPETGLATWKVVDRGFELQLIQVVPDAIRAMYGARGLPEAIIQDVASHCVFGTIAANRSDGTLVYRVAEWRYETPDGRAHPIKTKTQWTDEWKAMGVPYNWSILPDDQEFAPGDWSQGFTTIPLPPESTFTLQYSWTVDGETHASRI